MAGINQNYGTYTELSVVNLQSLGYGTATGWKSALIDNQTSVKATDYEIYVKLRPGTGSAPANDKAAYIYVCPGMNLSGGTGWMFSSAGVAASPTDGDATMAFSTTNNLKLLGVLGYNATGEAAHGSFNLSNAVGQSMPDGFLILISNFMGPALVSGTNLVAYRAITQTVV